MRVINVEIKARCAEQEHIRRLLLGRDAEFMGTDHQLDTYFDIPDGGRLKLREGDIENNLIYYERPDREGPKSSHCILYGTRKNSALKEILVKSLGIKVIIEKSREIYYLDNIKVHIDRVEGLGTFVEIEAQSEEGDLSEDHLRRQCSDLMRDFGIADADLVKESYSDLLLGG